MSTSKNKRKAHKMNKNSKISRVYLLGILLVLTSCKNIEYSTYNLFNLCQTCLTEIEEETRHDNAALDSALYLLDYLVRIDNGFQNDSIIDPVIEKNPMFTPINNN